MTNRWGKAGVRLTEAEMARNDARRARDRHLGDAAVARSLAQTRVKWAAGMVVPHYITVALNAKGLYGPEVDEACLASEPDVDMWEAGKLYPTFEQLCALAELTHNMPWWFCRPPGSDIPIELTSMRFHTPEVLSDPPPVWHFEAAAVAATVTAAVPQ